MSEPVGKAHCSPFYIVILRPAEGAAERNLRRVKHRRTEPRNISPTVETWTAEAARV